MRVLNSIQDSFARSDAMLAFSFTPFMLPIWQTALGFKGNTGKSLDDAARLLTERRGLAADQPAFAFINLMGVHLPYNLARHYVARFRRSLSQSTPSISRFSTACTMPKLPSRTPLLAHSSKSCKCAGSWIKQW